MVDAKPDSYQKMAGLIAYYNRFAFHYRALTFDDNAGTCLQVYSCGGNWPDGQLDLGLETPVAVPEGMPIRLRVEVQNLSLIHI